jgi:ferredoxin
MQNYGFVIDQSKCIGCHACTTACKSENQVPLGVNRTWVKYVETGSYPDVRRRFQVTRCNHCANPPCVRICPVTAMYQRDDGIVEFDPSHLHRVQILHASLSLRLDLSRPRDQHCRQMYLLRPSSGRGARARLCCGLPRACDPGRGHERPRFGNQPVLATAQATVRKPEQGTGPKLFYINGNDWSLHPTASPHNESLHVGGQNHRAKYINL